MTLTRIAWSAACLVWLSSAALGDTFQDRAALGKDAETAFPAYRDAMQKAAGQALANGMEQCFDSNKPPSTVPFVLVADLLPDGQATRIEVRPQTNISTCFASALAAVRFLPPPEYPDHRAFPIEIEMRITP